MKWQPIETAPKGVEWILLGYYPEYMRGKCQGGKPAIAYYDCLKNVWMECCGRSLCTSGTFSPTHWMPLPDPPSP